jgi:hypothetical protein
MIWNPYSSTFLCDFLQGFDDWYVFRVGIGGHLQGKNRIQTMHLIVQWILSTSIRIPKTAWPSECDSAAEQKGAYFLLQWTK